MCKKQQFVELTPNGNVQLAERELPEVGNNEVLIDVKASLLSPGTELYHIGVRRQGDEDITENRSMGYQNAGDVVQVGDDVEAFSTGDRVATMGTGYALHSDYALVPQNLCVQLPEYTSYEAGAFNHLAATAVHAVRRGQLEIGESAVVFGLGIVGQLTAQFAQISGAHTVAIGHHDQRVSRALDCGIETTFNSTDIRVIRSFFKPRL